MFSSRSFPDRDPNRVAQALAAARGAGRQLFDLTVSNPTRAGFPYAAATIGAALGDPGMLVYDPEPRGARAVREALVDQWAARGIETRADRVLLTASTSEAYALLFKLLCDPGDEVLAPQPSYPLFDHLARLESVALTPYPLAYDGAWHIDLPALRAAITARTRAILVVSPNNPTGSYLTRADLAALAELGLPIVCDEVFAEYPLRVAPERVRSVLEQRAGLVFALDGLSKLVALPQLKLGWITVGGSAPLVDEALARLELIADTYLSVGTPVQRAAPHLLAAGGATRAAIAARLHANLATLQRACRDTAATVLDVEGGWSAVVQLPRVESEEAWVLGLLDDGVVVQPGWFFDFPGEAYVVLSLLPDEATFREGVRRLVARVARLAG